MRQNDRLNLAGEILSCKSVRQALNRALKHLPDYQRIPLSDVDTDRFREAFATLMEWWMSQGVSVGWSQGLLGGAAGKVIEDIEGSMCNPYELSSNMAVHYSE